MLRSLLDAGHTLCEGIWKDYRDIQAWFKDSFQDEYKRTSMAVLETTKQCRFWELTIQEKNMESARNKGVLGVLINVCNKLT